jgi:hypothetical protein
MQPLLARGADLQLRVKQGASVVVLAARMGNWPVLALLLRQRAPWRDQRVIDGVPFLQYMEIEARKAASHAKGTSALAAVMPLLRQSIQ